MAIKASDNIKYYPNAGGPTITTVARPVFEADGLYFKDIDGTGKLPITLPKGDEVLAVNAQGVCISPNDVPGYGKDLYMPDSLKDENGKAYAYRDAAGNYYELNFGLEY